MTAESSPGATVSRMNAVEQFLAVALDWQSLTDGGSTNGLYRAQTDAQSLVLRLNADEQRAFGVDRQREAAVLASIQGYGWAPRVLHNPWQQGWCLMVDEGDPLTSGRGDSPLPALLDALAEWQQIDTRALAQQPFDYPSLFGAYRAALLAGSTPLAIRVLDRLTQLFTTLPPVSACLTHHDLHWGNLCSMAPGSVSTPQSPGSADNRSRLVILDWEYAAIANPWFDAAALQRQFGVGTEIIASLPAWRMLSPLSVERGLITALWLNDALSWLWYQVRGGDLGPEAASAEQAQRLLEAADAL